VKLKVSFPFLRVTRIKAEEKGAAFLPVVGIEFGLAAYLVVPNRHSAKRTSRVELRCCKTISY
jgi:hypothetical protein